MNSRGVDYLATTRLGEKGQLTIPKEFRDRLGLRNGAPMSVFALGNGLILIPEQDRLEKVGAAIAEALTNAGITAEAMLATLPAIRQRLAKRRYPDLFKARRKKPS